MKIENNFLTELNDYELAYFAKYNLSNYSEISRVEAKEFLTNKGLTDNKIEELISINPKRETRSGKVRCSRCSSDKINLKNSEKITCNVCGLNFKIQKDTEENTFFGGIIEAIITGIIFWK